MCLRLISQLTEFLISTLEAYEKLNHRYITVNYYAIWEMFYWPGVKKKISETIKKHEKSQVDTIENVGVNLCL